MIRFGIELRKAKIFSDKLLAATLIMSNKLLSKERITKIWEEIKMLDIIEIAMEKGRDEGEVTGIRKIVMELLIAKFSLIPQHVAVQVKKFRKRMCCGHCFTLH